MARWVSQVKTSSVSKSARTRVAYLEKVVPEVRAVVHRYLADRPEGEEITLEVLAALGRRRLVQLGGGADQLDRVKQDVGRLVPMVLVDLFGAARVLTFREDNERDVSTRAVRRSGLDWVSRFTPHRVLPQQHLDRIVLDTNAVRYLVQGGAPKDVLDLSELARLKGPRPVSIADAAWAEILEALVRPEGGISFEQWAQKASALDAVLDPDLPIVPGGRELVTLAGLIHLPGFDPVESAAFYRAAWRFTARARSARDLATTLEFEAADGKRFRVGPLNDQKPLEVLHSRGRRWEAFIQRIVQLRPEITVEQAAALMRENLERDLPPNVVDRLGVLVHAVAAFVVRAADPTQPYTPDINDALDIDVLYTAVLPAVVCTADKRLRNLARVAGASDGWRVMFPGELLDWLRAHPAAGLEPERERRGP